MSLRLGNGVINLTDVVSAQGALSHSTSPSSMPRQIPAASMPLHSLGIRLGPDEVIPPQAITTHVGLRNPGNNCWANACFQLLAQYGKCNPLFASFVRDYLEKSDGDPISVEKNKYIASFKTIFNALCPENGPPKSVSDDQLCLFFNAYSEFNKTKVERGIEKLELGFVDGPGKQYDSVQFFEDFISIFEPSSSSPLDVPVLRHHFKEIASETVARERYSNPEEMSVIKLKPSPEHSQWDLDTIIKNQSDLIGDNQYEWQESPNIRINATKETHLQMLPKDGFLIHVDRITSTNRQAPSVDQIKADTPIDLVVDKDTLQICVKFTIHGRDEYRALRSCCCHIGGAQAGHYVNWSLDGRTITKVSDDVIEQTQIPENNQSQLATIIKDISTSATLLLFGEAIMNFKAIDVKGGGAGCSVTNQDLLGGPKGSSNVISHSKGEQPKYDPKAAPSFKITGESYVIRPILNCVSAEVDLDLLKVRLGDEKYEQLKDVLSKLIKGRYICSHQADAVVSVVSSKFNDDTRGVILGDQPGVGKTRELTSIALVSSILFSHNALIQVSNKDLKDAVEKELNKLSSSFNLTVTNIRIETVHDSARIGKLDASSFFRDRVPKINKALSSNIYDYLKSLGIIDVNNEPNMSVFLAKSSYVRSNYSSYFQEINSILDRVSADIIFLKKVGILLIDECHNSITKQKASVNAVNFNQLLRRMTEALSIVLASATPAEDISSWATMLNIIFKNNTPEQLTHVLKLNGRHTQISASVIQNELKTRGLLCVRMLEDTSDLLRKIEDGTIMEDFFERFPDAMNYAKNPSSRLNSELAKALHLYDKIHVNFRILKTKIEGKDLNRFILPIMRRLEQDIMLKASILRAQEMIGFDSGYHAIFLIREHIESQTNRINQVCKSLYDNIHTMFTNKKNERYLYKIYVRLLLNRISESIDTLLLNPHKLESMGVHYNKEPKPNSEHQIWVHTEKLGTGFNLNGLLTPEAEFYRNQFQNFNLSVKFIGVEKSKAFFLQAIHRYVRLTNSIEIKLGKYLHISALNFGASPLLIRRDEQFSVLAGVLGLSCSDILQPDIGDLEEELKRIESMPIASRINAYDTYTKNKAKQLSEVTLNDCRYVYQCDYKGSLFLFKDQEGKECLGCDQLLAVYLKDYLSMLLRCDSRLKRVDLCNRSIIVWELQSQLNDVMLGLEPFVLSALVNRKPAILKLLVNQLKLDKNKQLAMDKSGQKIGANPLSFYGLPRKPKRLKRKNDTENQNDQYCKTSQAIRIKRINEGSEIKDAVGNNNLPTQKRQKVRDEELLRRLQELYGNLDDLCLDETTNHGELNEAIAELKDEVEELLEEFSNDELRGSYVIFVLISNQNINEDAKITLLNLLQLKVNSSDSSDFLYYKTGSDYPFSPPNICVDGWNPLHWAVFFGEGKLVNYIKTKASQLNHEKDKAGNLPIEILDHCDFDNELKLKIMEDLRVFPKNGFENSDLQIDVQLSINIWDVLYTHGIFNPLGMVIKNDFTISHNLSNFRLTNDQCCYVEGQVRTIKVLVSSKKRSRETTATPLDRQEVTEVSLGLLPPDVSKKSKPPLDSTQRQNSGYSSFDLIQEIKAAFQSEFSEKECALEKIQNIIKNSTLSEDDLNNLIQYSSFLGISDSDRRIRDDISNKVADVMHNNVNFLFQFDVRNIAHLLLDHDKCGLLVPALVWLFNRSKTELIKDGELIVRVLEVITNDKSIGYDNSIVNAIINCLRLDINRCEGVWNVCNQLKTHPQVFDKIKHQINKALLNIASDIFNQKKDEIDLLKLARAMNHIMTIIGLQTGGFRILSDSINQGKSIEEVENIKEIMVGWIENHASEFSNRNLSFLINFRGGVIDLRTLPKQTIAQRDRLIIEFVCQLNKKNGVESKSHWLQQWGMNLLHSLAEHDCYDWCCARISSLITTPNISKNRLLIKLLFTNEWMTTIIKFFASELSDCQSLPSLGIIERAIQDEAGLNSFITCGGMDAMMAIHNTKNEKVLAHFINFGGIVTLIELMKCIDTNQDLFEPIADVVSGILNHEKGKDDFINKGGLPHLIKFLEYSVTIQAVRLKMIDLIILVVEPCQIKTFFECDGWKHLIAVANQDDNLPLCRERITDLMTRISNDQQGRQLIMSEDGVNMIIKLANYKDNIPECFSNMVDLMKIVVSNENAKHLFLTKGGKGCLISMSKANLSFKCKSDILSLLFKIEDGIENRPSFTSVEEFMNVFREIVNSNNQHQVTGIFLAIGDFIRSKEQLTSFVRMGGLSILKTLVKQLYSSRNLELMYRQNIIKLLDRCIILINSYDIGKDCEPVLYYLKQFSDYTENDKQILLRIENYFCCLRFYINTTETFSDAATGLSQADVRGDFSLTVAPTLPQLSQEDIDVLVSSENQDEEGVLNWVP